MSVRDFAVSAPAKGHAPKRKNSAISTTTAPVSGVAGREPWVSLSIAAEYFGVSEKTLRRGIAAGDYPARRMSARPGSAIKVKLSEIEATMYPMGSAL